MPTDVNLKKDGMIYQREQYEKGGVARKYWDLKDERLLRSIGDRKTIVDIGCGEGILLEKIIKKNPDAKVFGIDAEEENFDICGDHGLDVRLGSVYDLELEDTSIDCVILSEVIEHLQDPTRAIAEISRALKKGGILIMLFPNDFTFMLYRLMMLMIKEAFYDTGHVQQWTPRKIRRALGDSKLRVVSQSNLPFYFWRLSLHHLVVAEKIV